MESFHLFQKKKKAIKTHICSWSIFLALGINAVGQMKAIPLNRLWYLKSSLVLFNCYLELTAASAWRNNCQSQKELTVSFKRCWVASSLASNLGKIAHPRGSMPNAQVEDKTVKKNTAVNNLPPSRWEGYLNIFQSIPRAFCNAEENLNNWALPYLPSTSIHCVFIQYLLYSRHHARHKAISPQRKVRVLWGPARRTDIFQCAIKRFVATW